MQGMAKKYRMLGMMQVNSSGWSMAAVRNEAMTANKKMECGERIPSFWICNDVPTMTAVINMANRAPITWANSNYKK